MDSSADNRQAFKQGDNMNSFSSNQNYPTLEEAGVNWTEAVGESVMQRASLEAAYLNLEEIRQCMIDKSAYPHSLDCYVAAVNALEGPRWVILGAATGIHVLRDYLAGTGFNMGSLTEMMVALNHLATVILDTKATENA